MTSKTYIFKKQAVKIRTGGGTTYTTKPTTHVTSSPTAKRKQIFLPGGKKILERTGGSGIVRVPVKDPKTGKTEFVLEEEAEQRIRKLEAKGLTKKQASDMVMA